MAYYVPDVPELWCDDCGPFVDGAEYVNPGASDSPSHCAGEDDCASAIDLREYGLLPDAQLYGAETRTIPALVSDELTEYGVEYLRELLAIDGSQLTWSRGIGSGARAIMQTTPYQKAVHAFWREAFSSYLED